MIYGGDGFYVLVDPTNPNFIYVESQNGGLAYSRNGGSSFSSGRTGINSTDRTNWSTPFVMDPNNSLKLYVGTFRIYKTTNGMQSWTAISGDLTYGAHDRIGTITTIDAARSDSNVIYVGADDGRVSVTTNGGSTWQDISASLPLRWVTRVSIDPESANVCYITHSGYLEYGFSAHIHKTTNFGQTWTNISGNLPDIPVNDIIIDPVYRPNLYIATDIGVMYSTNGGQNWFVLGSGLPEVTVHDLTLHVPTRKLAAFTHGRSAWFIDLTGLVGVKLVTEFVPTGFILNQNYPNPFNASTMIKYTLSQDVQVRLKVFNVSGQLVSVLVDEYQSIGIKSVNFDVKDLPSGVYYYKLTAGDFTDVKKMILAK